MILIVHVQTEASASNIVDTCEDGELLLLSLAIHFMYTSSVIMQGQYIDEVEVISSPSVCDRDQADVERMR